MVGLLVAGSGGDQVLGSAGMLFYAISYAIMTVGAFAVVSLFERTQSTNVSVDDLKGLGSRQPYLALAMSILMLSLAGLPPTVGFFGKFYLFSAAIDKGFYWLTVWAVLNSAISVYYYLRPLVVMYMSDEPGAEPLGLKQTRWALGFAAALVVVFGFVSHPIYRSVVQSVETLVR
jgi:NADH-quinone oxidoreductase subunit N